MDRLKEAVSLGLVMGVLHGLVQPSYGVPVVPNFTQGSLNPAYGNYFKSHRSDQLDGLQHGLSVLCNWYKHQTFGKQHLTKL